MKHRYLNGIKTYSPETSQELIMQAVSQKKKLFAINAEKIINLPNEDKKTIKNHLGYPDGFGAVWLLKKKGLKNAKKIPGCELWLKLIDRYNSSKTFYLIGGTQKVIESTIEKLKIQFPAIKISAYRNGYFNHKKDYDDLRNDILLKLPDVVFIAMGSPKQEKLINDLYERHRATYMGLGGSFDVYIGLTKRAPSWLIKNNLEWLYRLLKEPIRLFRQRVLISFFLKAYRNKI